MEPFRQSLIVQVIESSDPTLTPRVWAAVQLWRGQVHVTTVTITDPYALSERDLLQSTCAEGFAAIAARVAARVIDEELFTRIEQNTVHKLRDLQAEFGETGFGSV